VRLNREVKCDVTSDNPEVNKVLNREDGDCRLADEGEERRMDRRQRRKMAMFMYQRERRKRPKVQAGPPHWLLQGVGAQADLKTNKKLIFR